MEREAMSNSKVQLSPSSGLLSAGWSVWFPDRQSRVRNTFSRKIPDEIHKAVKAEHKEDHARQVAGDYGHGSHLLLLRIGGIQYCCQLYLRQYS
jgi:hypothetical protein